MPTHVLALLLTTVIAAGGATIGALSMGSAGLTAFALPAAMIAVVALRVAHK